MKHPLVSQAMTFVAILLLATAAHAQSTDDNPSTPGTSKVRIVRLSQVKGAVEIDRHIGRGFEKAIANLPVVEQSQVRTGVGIAEIEFEDNSSLRLAPNSLVEFPRLEREASGATASTVHLIQGTAYVSLMKPDSRKAPANQFELMFGERTLNLDPATHIRLDLQGSQAKLAVLDGAVHVNGEEGAVSVPKKKTAVFQIFDKNEPTVAKDIESSPFDAWDHDAAKYHSNVAAFSAYNSPYTYGLSDMSYYGSFVNGCGGGSMWRPYFASVGWDPYSNGTWAWYQGAGYSWVSPYPWAWTPYHTGSWSYCPDMGWGWMPGGGWNGLNNVAAVIPSTGGGNPSSPRLIGGPIRAPHAPAHAPAPNQPALVPVSLRPVARSEIASPSVFVFRQDSAGLGVPRGTMGRLDKASHQTMTHGIATTPIYASVPQINRAGGSMTTSQSLATTVHRGSSYPAPTGYGPTASGGSYNNSMSGARSSGASSASSSVSSPRVSAPSAPVASAPTASPRR